MSSEVNFAGVNFHKLERVLFEIFLVTEVYKWRRVVKLNFWSM